MTRIPLIEEMTNAPIPAGSNLLVEYDPASQWFNASLTIAAGWIKAGGTITYGAAAQAPSNVRAQLNRLGLNVEELERNDRLDISDWYTATLGQKSKEKYAWDSLKVADLSIAWSSSLMKLPAMPDVLRMLDDLSCLDRFNDEKSWVEFVRTRLIPNVILRKQVGIRGIIRGVHSDWAYKNLETAHDGIIDFKLEEEEGGKTRNVMRIRSMRNVAFEQGWHQLKVTDKFEVALEKQPNRP